MFEQQSTKVREKATAESKQELVEACIRARVTGIEDAVNSRRSKLAAPGKQHMYGW